MRHGPHGVSCFARSSRPASPRDHPCGATTWCHAGDWPVPGVRMDTHQSTHAQDTSEPSRLRPRSTGLRSLVGGPDFISGVWGEHWPRDARKCRPVLADPQIGHGAGFVSRCPPYSRLRPRRTCLRLSRFRAHVSAYFPMQKVEKISSNTASSTFSPVTSPTAWSAARTEVASRSCGTPAAWASIASWTWAWARSSAAR